MPATDVRDPWAKPPLSRVASVVVVRAAGVALAASLAASCVGSATARIPHPLVRGRVVEHRVLAPDVELAAHFGLPLATFTSEARLVSLDAQRACFQLTLRVNGDQQQLATPSEWRVYLRGEPTFEASEPIFGPPVVPASTVLQGTVPRAQFAGFRNECPRGARGGECASVPVYTTTRVPAAVTLLTGGGAVCFAHQGLIRTSTRAFTLLLDDPENALHRIAFRWDFSS